MSTFTIFGIAQLSVTINLVVALLLGALIGLERQLFQRYTGVSTHALVALGAAAFTSIAMLVVSSGDSTRIAGQVVTGIGFLGAGLIFRDGISVRGLSAAASVWATGAVGALAGNGLLIEAAEVAVLMLVANLVLPKLGRAVERLGPQRTVATHDYAIELTCASVDETIVRGKLLQAVMASRLRLRGIESHLGAASGNVVVMAIVQTPRRDDVAVERTVGELSLSGHVLAARWTVARAAD